MKINVRMTGFEEMDRLLEKLPDSVDRTFFLGIHRELLRPIAGKMKQRLLSQTKKRTGQLERSIGVRTLPKRSRLGTGTLVGQRYGIYQGFHAPLIERGTVERTLRSARVLKFKR